MLQKPKGTLDIYGEDGKIFDYISNYTSAFMSLYNYEFIKLPTFESTELFYRGVGDTTDIVNKETYDFLDKSNRKMTLRPEMTAGTARCLIEDKLYAEGVKKFYYLGSCFRYERPQSGRLREFTQFGIECFNVSNPKVDAEVISLAYRYLSGLGLTNLVVKLNSLGNKESRKEYNEVIKEYLSKDYDNLCDTCKERLSKNPLRILDCKYDGEREYIKNTPKTLDYLNEESKSYFEEVKESLESLGIPFVEDSTLVRGLDYYSHTVFEIISDIPELGKANTLCGGGRYDGLVELLGGPSTPGIGFAMGIERIIILLKELECYVPDKELDVFVMNLDNTNYAFQIIDDLRLSEFSVETDYTGKNMKGMWKLVDKLNPKFILIIGEDERVNDYITVKDNITKEETKVKTSDLIDYLNTNI
jgi:histidyl-tRNA synthetase